MKKIIVLSIMIAGCYMLSNQQNLEANSAIELGHWIDVHDGNVDPVGAVCAGSGEDCVSGDTKPYRPTPVILV